MRLLQNKNIYYRPFGLFIGCFLFAFIGYGQVDKLFFLSPDERVYQLWKTVYTKQREDRQLMSYLDSVKTGSEKHRDRRLYWYADFHRFFKKTIKETPPPTWYEQAETYAARCTVPVVKASCWFSFGDALFQRRDFDAAFKLLLRAENEFERIGYEHIPEASHYLYRSMEHYYFFEQYPKAIQYGLLAEQLTQLTPDQVIQGLNTLGMAYQRQKEYTKAKDTFLKVMSLAEEHRQPVSLGVASGNFGNTLRLEGSNREALPFLYTAYELNDAASPETTALTCLHLAKALLALDSVGRAKTYIERSLQLSSGKRESMYLADYYETQTLYFKKTDSYTKVAAYEDSMIAQKERLRGLLTSKTLEAYRSELNAEKYFNSINAEKTERSNRRWLSGIIFTALLLMVLAGIHLYSQHRENQQMAQQLEQEHRKNAIAQLQQYMAALRERNERLEKAAKELKVSNLPSDNPPVLTAAMYTLLRNMMITDKEWQELRRLYETAYPERLAEWKTSSTALNDMDLRLLMLRGLEVPPKEIALMLGMTVETIRRSRIRLRQKMEPLQANPTLEGLPEEA
ncbi:MAG: tetratricopeptide repeat protein [Spirosomataceae bacterium]